MNALEALLHRLSYFLFLCFAVTTFCGTPADIVYRNGNFYTVDTVKPRASTLAIKAGRIIAIGDDDRVAPHVGDQTRVVDLEGAFAMPGFVDSHAHIMGIGQARVNLRLQQAQSWQEIIDQVAEATKQVPAGSWILGRGWHQEKWIESPGDTVAGFPIHDALSAVSPDHPVMLEHASGHALFANTKAMELAGVDESTANPVGGEVLRKNDGQASGLFNETAEALIREAYEASRRDLTDAQRRAEKIKLIELAEQECLSNGVTTLQDAGSNFATVQLLQDLAEDDQLNVRFWIMAGDDNATLRETLPEMLRRRHHPYLHLGGIKRYVDGALGSRGAWLLADYEDQAGHRGHAVNSITYLKETAEIALAHGLQLCVHAIGDRGNREILDLFEQVTQGRDLRWRIEHAQHLHPNDIPRFAELKVVASMQGIHCTSDAPFVEKRLGHWRSKEGAYVWRKLVDSGALVANGTDAPVEAVDPIANLQALVTRLGSMEKPFFPEMSLTVSEAIKAYTLDAARAAFLEREVGSLTLGKWADFVVLSDDLTAIPPAEWSQTKVLQTVVAGTVRYSAP
jgi:predicted amidohydrolase YtcJ